MAERIIWKHGPHGGEFGYVGKRRLFSISHSMVRGRTDVLDTTLPIKIKEELSNGERDRLKRVAEAALQIFVNSLGAVFPE